MTDNIITPEFRAGFISIFKATAQKQDDGSMGAAKFSIRACFPPTADLAQMKAQASQAAADKWGGNIPKNLRSPFRLNEELDKPVLGIGDDWIIMTFSASEERKPGLVGPELEDIIDPTLVYSGAWFKAQIRAFGYEARGNKGISFGLQNVQKVKDDEPIGGARPPANKAFAAVGGGSGGAKSAAGIFG